MTALSRRSFSHLCRKFCDNNLLRRDHNFVDYTRPTFSVKEESFSSANMSSDTLNQQKNSEDYSASTTTIRFDRPLPLLRGPLLADQLDHPSAGPYVLTFRDYNSWFSTFTSSKNKVIEQCEEGARIGCAVGASKKCAPPWWDFKKVDLKAKEECEVREMNACLIVAKEKCAGFAKEKCLKPFMSARIAIRGRDLTESLAKRLIGVVGLSEKGRGCNFSSRLVLKDLLREERRLTYVRASELVTRADK